MKLKLQPSTKIEWPRLAHRFFLMGFISVGWFAWQSWAAAEDPARLFNDVCAVCHGVGGRGDGPSAVGLHPKPADFTDCKVMVADSDEMLFKIIKEGGQSVGRSTVMPSWKDSLTDSQIRALVKYIRGFCKK
jgi:mono/diheme cytochrome c family protein